MPIIYQDDWLRGSALTKWPFRPEATLASEEGKTFDEGVFLDAMIHPPGLSKGAYITSIDVTTTTITVNIGDESGTKCSAKFSKAAPPASIEVLDTYGRPSGVIVADTAKLTAFQTWNSGSYTFGRDAAEFVTSAVAPRPEKGVTGVAVGGVAVSGDVWLVGGVGVVLSHSQDTDTRGTYENVSINLVGSPLYNRTLCSQNDEGQFEYRRFIQRICFLNRGRHICCEPGQNGGVTLVAGNVDNDSPALRISTNENGINISLAGR